MYAHACIYIYIYIYVASSDDSSHLCKDTKERILASWVAEWYVKSPFLWYGEEVGSCLVFRFGAEVEPDGGIDYYTAIGSYSTAHINHHIRLLQVCTVAVQCEMHQIHVSSITFICICAGVKSKYSLWVLGNCKVGCCPIC